MMQESPGKTVLFCFILIKPVKIISVLLIYNESVLYQQEFYPSHNITYKFMKHLVPKDIIGFCFYLTGYRTTRLLSSVIAIHS